MISDKEYLNALRKGASETRLTEMEALLSQQSSIHHLIEILKNEIGQLSGKRSRLSQLNMTRVRLATLLENQSQLTDTAEALNAAIMASELWNHDLNDARGARRMHLRALWLSGMHFPDELHRAVHTANGPEATIHLLKDEIQHESDNQQSETALAFSQIMLQVMQTHGKTKKIFFETMKSIRKWPQNHSLHKQLRQQTELFDKSEEALFTLLDLLKKETEADRPTGLLLESIGRMHHLQHEDQDAFRHYDLALKSDPQRIDAWVYGHQLAKKLNIDFPHERPLEHTVNDGATLASPMVDTNQATKESRPTHSTDSEGIDMASIQSLDEGAILEIQNYTSQAPPPLPHDSQEHPPSLPPQDAHDDFDHIIEGEKQKLAMESIAVSEARAIEDFSDIDKTIVSAIPSLDDHFSSDFEEATIVQHIESSDSATQIGFKRGVPLKNQGPEIKAPQNEEAHHEKYEDESQESLEGPALKRLQDAVASDDNAISFSILSTYDPIYISSKWRARLLFTILEKDAQGLSLLELQAHLGALLEESHSDSLELITKYLEALAPSEITELDTLWAKTLAHMPEDRPPRSEQYEVVLLGAGAQPQLSQKAFALITLSSDSGLKEKMLHRLLPIWKDDTSKSMVYNELVLLMEQPEERISLCQQWAKELPHQIDAYQILTRAALKTNDFHLAKEGYEQQLLLSDAPEDKARIWLELAQLYLMTSPDYWREAANACVQAVGYTPHQMHPWIELVFVVRKDFDPQKRKHARDLLEDPNEHLISELQVFLDPIILDLANLPTAPHTTLRRLIGLLLASSSRDPNVASLYLEHLLDDFPQDLLLLEAYAHLLASHGLKPMGSTTDKLSPLEGILSAHAESLDVMKQVSLWGDLGTVRWAAGDYSGAISAIENLFNLLPTNDEADGMSDRLLDTALSVLDSPQNKDQNQQLLIKTLELKAKRQNTQDALHSIKRALALASKHNPAKAKKLLLNVETSLLDMDMITAGKKAYDNLDLLEEFCDLLRKWLKEDTLNATVKQPILEMLVEVEGQLLRHPHESSEGLSSEDNVGTERHAQAASLLLEVGDTQKAIEALRQSVIKDLNDPQAWQKLFESAQQAKDPDLMFLSAQALSSLSYASVPLAQALKNVPQQAPTALHFSSPIATLAKILRHPFEKGMHSDLIAELAQCSVQLFGKPLSSVGLMQRQQLKEHELSPQWRTMLQNMYQLLEFESPLLMFENHRHMNLAAMLAPTAPPALVFRSDATQPKSPLTHSAAFYLGRALYWGLPDYQLISILNIQELKGVFTALRAYLLKQVHPQTAQAAMKSGKAICNAYLASIKPQEGPQAIQRIIEKLSSHETSLESRFLQRFQQGVSLSSNRVGLLMCGDVSFALQCIDELHHGMSDKSRLVAYRDVLGFAISDAHLAIRQQLGWKLSDHDVVSLSKVVAAI